MWRTRSTLPAATLSATGDLTLLDVTRSFGSFVAVDDLTLTIPDGSFFAIVGPSGCGKTTTLRMVAGLDHPTEGQIRIGDTDITDTRPHERPVNTVFQSYALFPHLSVLDNVAFGPVRRGVSKSHARREAMEALALVQLAEVADRRPSRLSGGQQQRVALARAIVNRPEVLLLDEPLGALDLKLRRQMQVELKRIHREVGLTFVHVTHDQEEAMSMATTVAVMNEGRVEQMGAPATLYDLPHTTFVANFLGRSNLGHATVAGVEGDLVVLELAGHHVRVLRSRMTTHAGVSIVPGRDVVVGVRPEKVRLVSGAGAGRGVTNRIARSRVLHAGFTGVSTEYVVDVPGAGEWSVFEQNVEVDTAARVGDEVAVEWDLRHTFALPGTEDILAGTVERSSAGERDIEAELVR